MTHCKHCSLVKNIVKKLSRPQISMCEGRARTKATARVHQSFLILPTRGALYFAFKEVNETTRYSRSCALYPKIISSAHIEKGKHILAKTCYPQRRTRRRSDRGITFWRKTLDTVRVRHLFCFRPRLIIVYHLRSCLPYPKCPFWDKMKVQPEGQCRT